MKSINATLLANQKLPAGQAFATAALADNSRLHPTLVASASHSASSNTIGCACGTFYVRLRYVIGVLTVQKITDPTIASQWNTWTAFQPSGAGTTYGIAIFWTGTYCVICWQDLPATGDIKYQRSTDGVAWSAAVTLRAGSPAVTINIGGISAASPNCGLVLSYGQRLHFRRYDDSANTWSIEDDNGFNLTDVTPQCNGFYDTIKNRYIFAVETNTFVTWANYAIVLFTRATGAPTQAWSAGQVVFGGNGLHYRAINFAQRQVGGYWWMIFSKSRPWNSSPLSTMLISTSNDGLFWEDPYPTNIDGGGFSLCLLPPPSGGTWANAYLANEAGAYRLDTYNYWNAAPVMHYHYNTGHGANELAPLISEGVGHIILHGPPPPPPTTIAPGSRTGEHNPHPKGKKPPRPVFGSSANPTTNSAPSQARLVITLDNRDGAVTAPRLFSILTVTRGLIIGGVSYGQSCGTYYVTAFRYLLNDLVLELQATDAHGLLATWFSHNVFTYRNQTVAQLVEAVCALAGVHTVAFDAFPAWTDLIAAYSHPVANNAHFSLRSLATRVPFEFIAREDGSLYFYVPTAAPSSLYTFGSAAGQHAMWPGSFGLHESVTYIQVTGNPPRTSSSEGLDSPALYDGGRKSALIINDRSLSADAQVTALANAALVSAQEHKHAGLFEAPPSFALEPGDVISFGIGSNYAATVGPWRVEEFEEHFNANGARPFFQRITVRGTA